MAKKAAKKVEKEQPKEEPKKMVTCPRCGTEYQDGAPHAMFCRGKIPPGSQCVECGEDDPELLQECVECNAIVCDFCVDDEKHDCG